MKTEQYRIDRDYKSVYELNAEGDAYEYLCSFYQLGVCALDSDEKILLAISEKE